MNDQRDGQTRAYERGGPSGFLPPGIEALLRPLASLRLTVFLLGLAIFIVFVGTLAQARLDMWEVMADYFRAGIAWIDPDVFFPPAWFPEREDFPKWFAIPFPGGFTIGVAMAVNLMAAHLVRFRVTGSGIWLAIGWCVMGLGGLVTWLVVASGHNDEGLQGEPLFSWDQMWMGVKIALAIATALNTGALINSVMARKKAALPEMGIMAATAAVFWLLSGWTWFGGEHARLPNAALRVLWQLCQGGLAGMVLLAGCGLVFGRKAGIVLIHLGVGMLMFGELYVSMQAREEHMLIEEGRTVDFASESRFLELAIVDASDSQEDVVTVAPVSLLLKKKGELFENATLPFSIRIKKFLKNSGPATEGSKVENLATQGMGRGTVVVEKRAVSGADTGRQSNIASAYVEFVSKEGKSLGTWLLSQFNTRDLNLKDVPEKVAVDGKTYDVYLRLKRNYKPYRLHVSEVRGDTYLGTRKARNYSSDVTLKDGTRGVNHSALIRMNEPLRYAGETFYQSGYNEFGSRKFTTLQVVTNRGWMMPYVGCGMVAVGMAGHFLLILAGFLTRRRQAAIDVPATWADRWIPVIVVVFCILYLGGKWIPRSSEDALDIARFGRLPLAHKGRVKPFDSLARNTLRAISKREEFTDSSGEKQTATRWLLDLAVDAPEAEDHRILRVENDELLKTLGLEKRSGLRYSLKEVEAKLDTLREEFTQIKKVQEEIEKQREDRQANANDGATPSAFAPAKLTVYQQKVLELLKHLEMINHLRESLFIPPEKPTDYQALEDLIFRTAFMLKNDADREPPLASPTGPEEKPWKSLTVAVAQARIQQLAREHQLKTPQAFIEYVVSVRDREQLSAEAIERRMLSTIESFMGSQDESLQGAALRKAAEEGMTKITDAMRRSLMEHVVQELKKEQARSQPILEQAVGMILAEVRLQDNPPPAIAALDEVFQAYRSGSAKRFQEALALYEEELEAKPPAHWTPRATWIESYFNQCSPFYYCAVLYVIAFVVGVSSWLAWGGPLGRSAFALVAFTLILHTVALAARIYISGRPPVTNLYSSAIFIGWAVVLFGLILDGIDPLRIGTVVASVAGFITLLIAYFLSLDGDTIEVLEAVLDTQIWLATHVVTITLGYAATYLAGLLSLVYLLLGLFTTRLTLNLSRVLARMIYGVVCFAIFFSLVGTVLGGLWADDSWGRFWGWDPKENGALIIVLWNALVLHARWCGMVRSRGLAVLGVGGNIVTSWSWFGVNQLGVGLHSYGFNDKLMMVLVGVAISQALVMLAGLLPQKYWLSSELATGPDGDEMDVASVLAAVRK